jgi:hypothetical protein
VIEVHSVGAGSDIRAPELGAARRRPRRPARPAQAPTELTRVGWTPRADIGLDEWSAFGRRFGEIGRCSQWWLGDWIHYGNTKFGERYSRAAKLTGYDVQSLMNMVYVASRFEIYRRRENLSWSHHATVASFDVPSQEYWLGRAVVDKLSVADLRVESRSWRRALQAPDEEPSHETKAHAGTLVCPSCGEVVPLAPS